MNTAKTKYTKKDIAKIQAFYNKCCEEYLKLTLEELKVIGKTKLSSTQNKALYDSAVIVQDREIKEGNLKATME